VWLDLVPREISAIGVRLEANDQRSVLIGLFLALAYFFAAFIPVRLDRLRRLDSRPD
jgi:hypothetical protein